ncbi:MAG: tRNA uracil 4-sulfurtransferase ThiI [Deltaproteobacteria bacterium]|nr:tRNA uracil 4-sulfurtransferase ThiI [Deltaproteobacteria bacterium]
MSEAPSSRLYTALLCRYGELFLKSGNRQQFEHQLERNIRRAIKDIPGATLTAPHGRIVVRCAPEAFDDLEARVRKVFGLVSISPVACPPTELEAIVQTGLRVALAAVTANPNLRRSFKVQTKRAIKTFEHRSYDISCAVADRIIERLGIPVDVHDPAFTVGIEISKGGTFMFAETLAAPGGLPVGSAGKGLLLLSGGIDSPVAAYLAAKRGLSLEGVYFHSPPFVGEKTLDKVVSLARVLRGWDAMGLLWVVPFTKIQERIRESCRADLGVVLYRRMMMRIADRLADRLKADALVTGETLSQVASQTVRNMGTIEAAAQHLVLRPLLTFDKVETIEMARRIGTFDLSTLPYDDCCSLFVPPNPATGARPADAVRSEENFDFNALADEAADAAERVSL